MTWTFAYTPAIWPSLISAVFLLFLAIYSWHRREIPGALPFLVSCLFTVLSIIGLLATYLAVHAEAKIFWYRFEYSWILPATSGVTCFVLEYAWPGRWLTRRNLVLLSIVPLLSLLLVWTDGSFVYASLGFIVGDTVTAVLGPAGVFFLGYSILLTLIDLCVFTWLFIRSPQHRWPVFIMASTHIGVRLLLLPHPLQPDLLVYGWPVHVLPYISFAIALFGFRIFDPLPLARQAAVEQLNAGMVVLDPQGRVINVNPFAERILCAAERSCKGRHIQELLPACPEAVLKNPGLAEVDLVLEAGPAGEREARYYTLSTSPIKDWRGREAGRLLLLQDVTRRKQAEADLNESREIQRLIFENASEGIAIYEEFLETHDRRLLDCNERYVEMSGYSREKLLALANPAPVQKPLTPVPYAKSRLENWAAQSEGFFSWLRPDGQENIIEYNAATVQFGKRLLSIGLDRDVTGRMQAEAQIREQQRALAMLQEREQLARELHDSIGQVLAYTGFQVEAAAKLVRDGQDLEAGAQLERLCGVVREAHADVREQILNLRSTPSPQQPFLAALRQYLEGFQNNYGIVTDLVVPPGLAEEPYPPDARLHVFRILQEALSNARKHGQARRVQVTLRKAEGQVSLAIQDDGQGFDPVKISAGQHYGLQFMRERAEQIGGRLEIQSTPGTGACVLLVVPLEEQ